MAPIGEEEDRRLRTLERSYDPVTVRRLDSLGVRVDWRCLTLSAGGGAVTRWLRQRVGPTGRVMSADLDPYLLAGLPDGPFDLIHARALVTRLPDRDGMIASLVRRLWPGGMLLVEESDDEMLLASAAGPYRTVWEHACRLLQDDGLEPGAARRLPSLLRAAGLVDVGAEATAPMFAGGSPAADFARQTWLAARDRLLAGGLGEHDLAAALTDLDDPALWFPNWGVVAAWGRRPAVVVSY